LTDPERYDYGAGRETFSGKDDFYAQFHHMRLIAQTEIKGEAFYA